MSTMLECNGHNMGQDNKGPKLVKFQLCQNPLNIFFAVDAIFVRNVLSKKIFESENNLVMKIIFDQQNFG